MKRFMMVAGLCFGVLRAMDLKADAPQDSFTLFEQNLYRNRETSLHRNYFLVASDHGETRPQFLLSIKYELWQYLETWWPEDWPYRPQGLDLAYDGLYDFYLFTRPSAPVVSRTQNPGLFIPFKAPRDRRVLLADEWDFGWFHESNGQTIDNAADYNAAYAKMGQGVQDLVSRGWDYWYLSAKFSGLPWDRPEDPGQKEITHLHHLLSFQPVLRLYTGAQGVAGAPEEGVFWKPQAEAPYIYDYDGIRGSFSWELIFPDVGFLHFRYVGLEADLRTGYNSGHFAANWSRRFSLTFKTGYCPWFVYYNDGYGPYISDYSTYSRGWGAGITLW